jgi:hypothetical protein
MRNLLFMAALTACAAKSDGDRSTTEATPPTPLSAESLDVSFQAEDGLMLEGTLKLPKRDEGQPVLGVVLVHGSGPNSRDAPMAGQLNMGFGFEIEVFKELSKALANEGMAVLRYDKRSCFDGNGCDNAYPLPPDDLLVQDFADDAASAIDFLTARADVDGVVVLGHSQGASFVPQLLLDRPNLIGGVMLAGGHQPIDALVAFQYTSTVDLLTALGTPQETIDAQTAVLAEWVADLEALRAGTFEGDQIGGVPPAFWEDWFRITDATPVVATTVTQPMLALSGDYDWNIPPSETEAWAAQFEGSQHQATVLPCVTHALNCVSQPAWTQIEVEDLGTEIDTQLLEDIVRWTAEISAAD